MEDRIKNSKMLTEFMGYKLDEQSNPDAPSYFIDFFQDGSCVANCPLSNMLYNCSWDYLMPVVEKINSIENEIGEAKFTFSVMSDYAKVTLEDGTLISRMDCLKPHVRNAYHVAVEFVEWLSRHEK